MKVTFTVLSLLITVLLGLTLAQQPTNEPPVRLPAVTVIAEKEPAAAQSLPVSVTAVTAETIHDADVRSVKAAAVYAPNVFMNEFTARKVSNPFFRGIGASPNNPGVTTYIDGVPQLNANSSSIELIDIDQIEFVRGPQGALYGRNTVGGLINLTSRRPTLDAWRATTEGGYGNYNFRDGRLTYSGPVVTNQLGLSVAGGYSARDGFTRNDVTGHYLDSREAFFGKGQLLWVPVTDWEVRLILSGERAQDGDYALGDLAAIRARPHHVAHDFEGFTDRDVIASTLAVNHTGAMVDFTMLTGLVHWKTLDATDLDYSPIPAATRINDEKEWQFTEELRLASAKDAPVELTDALKLKWQTGVFIFTQQYEQDAVNNFAPFVLSPFIDFPVSEHAPKSKLDDVGIGTYAQTTLTAWDKLDLILGVRGDYEDKTANLNTSFVPAIAPATALNQRADFSSISPQFGLDYRLTSNQMVYATVTRGYKTGGFNPIAPAGVEAYGQETSWNYELGAKTTWFDNRLALNLDFFYIRWNDLQLNLPTGSPGQFYIANAGNADSKGIELELNARPIAGWDIFTGVGTADALFRTGATAGHTDAAGVDSSVNVTGRHLIYTPDITAHGGTQYAWAVCKAATLYARSEVVVYGHYYYNPVNTAGQDTYSLAKFRAGVRGAHWFAEGWIDNAFDTHYIPIAFEFPNGQSGFVGENGAPVTFGMRAGLSF